MAEGKQTIEQLYRALAPNLKRLETECKYIIEEALQQTGIKTHSVLSRVKTLGSAQEKLTRKEKDGSLEELEDLLGLRIVCLLRSDIPRIGELVRNEFDVVVEDNKLDGANIGTFGYQSVHFIAKLHASCKGRRYNGLHGQLFEIQLRTVAMDSWATLSHYLDYKNEADVPKELRKDFFALSGLFYVADTHFEMFYASRKKSEKEAAERIENKKTTKNEDLNLDTLRAYLRKKYPQRKPASAKGISTFLEELTTSGYADFGKIDHAINKAYPHFSSFEEHVLIKKSSKAKYFYADVGAARISLFVADENYRYSGSIKRAYIFEMSKTKP